MKNRTYFSTAIPAMLLLLFLQLLYEPLHAFPASRNIPFSVETSHDLSPLADTTHLTICNNQLPYTWNGLSILSSGIYTTTVAGNNGLDSVVVLNLNVIDVGTSITNVVICNNQLPYRWNGLTVTSSGTYSVTLNSSNGCDSVPILSLTVNDVVTSSTSISVCKNNLPYVWNGNSYTATGSYNVTLTSVANCDSIATLIFLVKDTSASTTEMTTCSNRLPFNWNGFSYAAAGSYSVKLNGANGCDSVAHLNLIVNPVAGSVTRIEVCSNQLPYVWNGTSYSSQGGYSKVFTSASGCDSVARLFLTVIPVQQSQTDLTVCPAQLPFSWNGNTYPVAGNYSITLTSSQGCDSIARLRLTVTDILRDTTSRVVCVTDLPFNWNGNDYTLPGTYAANFVTAAGCDSIATLKLSLDNPSVQTDSLEICSNELPYNYHGHIFTSAGIYPISPPVVIDACHSINLLNLVVRDVVPGMTQATVCANDLPYTWNGIQYHAAGSYTLTLTSSSGCDSLATLELTVPDTSSITVYSSACADQLPYVWNGTAYFTSGQYVDTLQGIQGCDSIVTLNLNILPSPRDTTIVNICPLQLPFSWEGLTLTGPGFFSVTFISNARCDSVKVIDLRVSAVIRTTTDTIVCGNTLPFIWNGQPYNLPGSYSVQLQNSAGCDSVVTLNLTINNDLESTTVVSTCVSQLPFSWNGNSYTSSGSYSITLVNNAGCDSVAHLNLTVTDLLSSESTITICNNQLPYSWNGNSYAVAGNYVVNLTSSAGCDSLAILHLIVTDILTSTTNVTVCPAQLPYSWNGNLYSGEGTYAITLSTPNGCDSVPILSLTVAPFLTSITQVSVCENQLPFSWNNQNFTVGGSFTVMLTTAFGCDSIATLQLSVIPTDSIETRFTICENELPFLWNGDLYTAAGVFYKTFSTFGGCDSVAILRLAVHPVDTSTTSVTVCTSELPFFWNGMSIISSGLHISHVTSQAGCDSVAVLWLTVNEPSLTLQQVSICSLQLPYTWNGQLITTGGIFADTLTNAAGCDSIVKLQLNVNEEVVTQLTLAICTNDLPFSWNGQSISSEGSYTANFINQAGCDSIVRLTLTVNPVQSSTTTAVICTNQAPYSWNGLQLSSSGNYRANLVTQAGCDSLALLLLTIREPSFTHVSDTICSAELPFFWNGNSYHSPGEFRDTLQNVAGCDSIITLNLIVNQTPLPVSVSEPPAYCQFETTTALTATADSGMVLQWYTSATGGGPSTSTPIPSSQTPGTFLFFVSQRNQACEGPRSIITVTVNPKPDLGDDRAPAVCYGETADLTGLYNLSGLTFQWTYAGAPLTPSNVVLPGIYSLVALNAAGCADTANVNFTINPPVFSDAGDDADVEANVPYRLQGSGNGSFSWSPANILNNAGVATPMATVSRDATLYLTVTDNLGCSAVDTVNLRVLNGPTFYVPSAFTPNGDGNNDIFRPTPVGIHKLDFFRVYNRYGELVFETSEIGKGWDGIYKGVKQNGGNYVWALKGVDRLGRKRTMKGNMVLIR